MQKNTINSIKYLDKIIEFETFYSDRLKTIKISIDPSKKIRVYAPKNTPVINMGEIVKNKGMWILKKFSYFDSLNVEPKNLEFKNGETHFYLGVAYVLNIVQGTATKVYLEDKKLVVVSTNFTNELFTKKLIDNWYWENAKTLFENELNNKFLEFNVYNLAKPIMTVERLKKKWGQCSSKGHIKLNKELVKLPLECLNYVIVHELCHLIEHNHSPRFYKLLGKHYPDWKKQKEKLNNFRLKLI
ncbi:M48 family metallopeptidase [candidate division WWE3 bacterium]|nr:M48 family metallopeptidase [candidate division WWE3 bacterium]